MSRPNRKSRIGHGSTVHQQDNQAEIAEFIRIRGVTRCPTACVVPTQGLVDVADRAALEEYGRAKEQQYQTRASLEAEILVKLSQSL
jgi:hypothetical protein